MPGPRQELRRHLMRRAFAQAGYFTAAQALELGYSYQAQKYHVDRGNWLRIDRGLYRMPDWPIADDDAYVRWSLWGGGRAVVSHATALSVHDLSDLDPARIHLTVPASFRRHDGAVVLHQGELVADDVETRTGWRVTTPLRSLVDVAEEAVSQEHIDAAVLQALHRGLTSRRALLQATSGAPDRVALKIERALATAQARL